MMLRPPRHPIADLPCGSPAKFTVNFGGRAGPVSSEPNKDIMDACGRHANYWAVRNNGNQYAIEPIKD